jgi:XTP/dITP diphosphohydrolase
MSMKIVLATNNEKKLKEMRAILSELGFTVLSLREAGVELEVEETGSTFAENAALKAEAAMRATGLPAIADDSGLVVDVLGGAPGVYSARYGGDVVQNDKERYELLLQNLRGVPEEARGAYFICSIACHFPDGRRITAEGRCHGRITHAPAGSGGFGYDPVFFVEGEGVTMAELSPERKNRISHRARAIREFSERIRALGGKQ